MFYKNDIIDEERTKMYVFDTIRIEYWRDCSRQKFIELSQYEDYFRLYYHETSIYEQRETEKRVDIPFEKLIDLFRLVYESDMKVVFLNPTWDEMVGESVSLEIMNVPQSINVRYYFPVPRKLLLAKRIVECLEKIADEKLVRE